MRIALIPELFYPYQRGGVERRYYEIARRLAKKHEVFVFAIGPPDRPRSESIDGVSVYRVMKFRWEMLYKKAPHVREAELSEAGDESIRRVGPPILYALSLLRLVFKKHRFDVVDCSAFPYLHVFSSRLLASLWRAPFVLTVHEVWGSYWRDYTSSKYLATMGMAVEKLCYDLPERFICVSSRTAENLKDYLGGGVSKKIAVVPNGVDSVANRRLAKKPREKALSKVKEIVYAGRLVHHKRVNVLIHAFTKVRKISRDIRLRIIGDGPLREPLEKQAKSLGVGDAVIFMGVLGHEEFLRTVASSHVFAFPSVREGFAMSVLEAMSVGTPPIVVDHAYNGALDYVKNGFNGLVVKPNDPEEFAEAILYLIQGVGRSEYVEMCQNCLATAEKYDWSRIISTLEELYQEVSRS